MYATPAIVSIHRHVIRALPEKALNDAIAERSARSRHGGVSPKTQAVEPIPCTGKSSVERHPARSVPAGGVTVSLRRWRRDEDDSTMSLLTRSARVFATGVAFALARTARRQRSPILLPSIRYLPST
jgi:hypothetical protein